MITCPIFINLARMMHLALPMNLKDLVDVNVILLKSFNLKFSKENDTIIIVQVSIVAHGPLDALYEVFLVGTLCIKKSYYYKGERKAIFYA